MEHFTCSSIARTSRPVAALFAILLFSATLNAQISGTFTLGGGSPDFTSFQHAVDSLTQVGVNGPVVINIASGTYHEQVSIPAITGASATNTITFKSATGDSTDVVMEFMPNNSSATYVLRLDNASHIRLERFTLKALSGGSYARALRLWNEAESNRVEGMQLLSPVTTNNSDAFSVVFGQYDADAHNAFSGNYFKGGSYGIYLQGTNTSNLTEGTVIENNVFDSSGYRGIYLHSQDAPVIRGNRFLANDQSHAELINILIYYSYNGIEITNNRMTSGYRGIDIYQSNGAVGDRGLVANNMIHITNDKYQYPIGIFMNRDDNFDVMHNTVRMDQGGNQSRALEIQYNSGHVVQNNIFANYDDNSSSDYAVRILGTPSNYSLDRNIYFSNGSIGSYSGNRTTLGEWQWITSLDMNSYVVDPQLPASDSLYTPLGKLANFGTDVSSIVSEDYLGQTRDSEPSPGALEFSYSRTPMSGTYTIDPAGAGSTNFTTFNAAVDSLDSLGIGGNVIFNVAAGTYNEQVLIPRIIGTGNDSILFQSTSSDSTDVAVEYATASGSNYVVRLEGASHIHFRNMTLRSTGTSDMGVLRLADNAHHNSFEAMQFLAPTSNSGSDNEQILFNSAYENGSNDYKSSSFIRIEGSYFEGGSKGVFFATHNNNYPGTNNIIRNNRFHDNDWIAIQTHEQRELLISGNTITSGNAHYSHYGIYLDESDGIVEITGNDVEAHAHGIYLNNVDISGTDSALVANNQVRVRNGYEYDYYYGITLNEGSGIRVYHNSVDIQTSTNHDSYSFRTSNNDGHVILNNIFNNSGGGYAFYWNGGSITSDYNDLYTNGTYIGYWGANSTDLADWQSVSGQDANSYSVLPMYLSSDTLKAQSPFLDENGVNLTGLLPNDITGAARTMPVSMGAFEYNVAGQVPMVGTYTIDPANAANLRTFASFTEAIDSLNYHGVSDSVFIEIVNGTYNEAVRMREVYGASASSPIYFRAQSADSTGVVMEFATNADTNYVWHLSGADHINLEGFTLRSTGTGNETRVLTMTQHTDSIRLDRMQFIAPSSNANSSDVGNLIWSYTQMLYDFHLSNSYLEGGTQGVKLSDQASSSTGTIIEGNRFHDNDWMAISVRDQQDVKIRNNTITSGSAHYEHYGIYLHYSAGLVEVTGNNVESRAHGIYLDYVDTLGANSALVANNQVRVTNGYQYNTYYGINLNEGSGIRVYHNSVDIQTNSNHDSYAFRTSNNDGHVILNNIFKNSGGGFAFYWNGGNITSDYNDLYTNGTYIGYWNGNRTNLADWQSVSNQDANSYSVLPLYQSNDTLKAQSPFLDEAGTDLTAVIPTDFTGAARTAPVSIGAFEYQVTGQVPMAGTYTIDPANAANLRTFASFTEAIDSLNYHGVSDSVFIEIVNGTYNESVQMREVVGVSANAPIYFRAQSADSTDVVMEFATNADTNYVWHLSGADHINLEGFTLRSTGTGNETRVLTMTQHTDSIRLDRMQFIAPSSNANSSDVGNLIWSYTQMLYDFHLSNSYLEGGTQGVKLSDQASSSTGTLIEGNRFHDNDWAAISVRDQQDVKIRNNTITSGSAHYEHYGIYLHYSAGLVEVTGNNVESRAHGIYLDYVDVSGTDSPLVANNQVRITNGYQYNTYYGINLNEGSGIRVYHNSVDIQTNSNHDSYAFRTSNNDGHVILNNIFKNSGGGFAFYWNGGNITSDYNDLYTTGTYIGYWSGDRTNLADWQSASGQDANSYSVLPLYQSSDTLKAQTSWLDDSGVDLLSAVPTDFLGNPRSAPVSIGAYEYDLPNDQPMSGVYTIDPATAAQDSVFASFTEAIDSLHYHGVSGAVVFEVVDSTFTEAVQLREVPGVDATNHVTFRAINTDSTATILQFATNADTNYVWQMFGADHINLEGFTLKSLGTGNYLRVLDLTQHTDSIHLSHMQVIAPSTNIHNNNDGNLIWSHGHLLTDFHLKNSYLEGGSYGVKLDDQVASTTGTQIDSNYFHDNDYVAIYAMEQNGVKIRSNRVTYGNSDQGHFGIWTEHCDGAVDVLGNDVKSKRVGLYLKYADPIGNDSPMVANNEFIVEGVYQYDYEHGLYVIYSSGVRVFHNVVDIRGNTYQNRSYAFQNNGANGTIIFNNVFHNSTGGYAYYRNSGTNIASDYNNLYTAGANLAYWGGAQPSLGDLQTASSLDSNSYSIDPLFLAPDTLEVTTPLLANGGADITNWVGNDINGVTRTLPVSIGAYEVSSISVPMAGVYDIDPANASLPRVFNSFNQAVDSLKFHGMSGTVIFEIAVDSFYEHVVLDGIFKENATDSIIFRNPNGDPTSVVLRYAAPSNDDSNYVFSVRGLRHVFLEDFTIKAEGSYSIALRLNGVDSSTFSGMRYVGPATTSSNTRNALVYHETANDRLITYRTSTFMNGDYGLYLRGAGFPNEMKYVVIDSNTFIGNYYRSIEMQWQDSVTITNNNIDGLSSAYTAYTALYCNDCDKAGNITGNRITSRSEGIHLYDADFSSDTMLVANNMIYLENGSGSDIGIYLQGCNTVNVFHNTVLANSSNGHALYSTGGEEAHRVYNNILVANNGGWAINGNTATSFVSDYNDLYTDGSYLGRVGGTNYTDLAGWIAATNNDSNSLSMDPAFGSSNSDTLYATAPALSAAGTDLTYAVTNDIDGDARTLPVSLGADEMPFVTLNPLAGTYIIAEDGTGDYLSFTEAVDDMKLNGVADTVVFLVKEATYTEQISIPAIQGVSGQAPVHFAPYSSSISAYSGGSFSGSLGFSTDYDVILENTSTHSDTNWTLRVDGADHFHFHGFTVKANGTSYGRVVHLHSTSDTASFDRMRITAPATTNTSNNFALVYANGGLNNGLEFIGNEFQNGSFGLYLRGVDFANVVTGLWVNDNTFSQQFYYGMYLDHINASWIEGNMVEGLINTHTDYTGIYCYDCDEGLDIVKNQINAKSQGITLNNVDPNDNDTGLIANNMIYVEDGSSSDIGIYLINSDTLSIFHNSVLVKSANGHALYAESAQANEAYLVQNNIFAAMGGGYAIHDNTSWLVVNSDYNDLFSDGAYLARWYSTDYTDLAGWVAGTNQDQHSMSVNPRFQSETSSDLFTSYFPLGDTGTTLLSYVPDDIQGDARDAKPSLGADEFATAANPLCGNYIIDQDSGTGTDFTSIQQAVDTLAANGISCPVTLTVRRGSYSYNEQVLIPEIFGTNENDTILFTSEFTDSTQVVISYSATASEPYVILFDEADHITFRNFTIQNTNFADYSAVRFQNGAQDNRLAGNRIMGVSSSTAAGDALLYSTGGNNDRNEIIGNRLELGSYGVYWEGDNSVRNDSLIVSGNQFIQQEAAAARMRYMIQPQFNRNTITSNTSNSYYYGVYIYDVSGSVEVNRNKITGVNQYGIEVENYTASAGQAAHIVNNMIQVDGGTSGNAWGILSQSNDTTLIAFNSINVTGGSTNGRAIYLYSSSNQVVLNNNLANTGSGYALYDYNSTITSDYNNWYATGTNVAHWDGVTYSDLAAMQAASGQDANSESWDPLFFSSTDLRTSQALINNRATPVAGITTDYFGTARSASTPDIGAHEFTGIQFDLAVEAITNPQSGCDLGYTEKLKVRLQNYGSDTATNFVMSVRVNGQTWTQENPVAAQVPPGAPYTYTFDTLLDMSTLGAYAIEVAVALPGDGINANDTLQGDTINRYRNFNVAIIGDSSICEGDTVRLSAFGSNITSYNWSTGSNQEWTDISPNASKTYTLAAANSVGCTDTATVNVQVAPKLAAPVIIALGSDSLCYNDTTWLKSSIGGSSSTWRLPDGTTQTADTIAATITGWYTHWYQDISTSCQSYVDSYYIYREAAPEIAIVGVAKAYCSGDEAVLRIDNACSYSWSNGGTGRFDTVVVTSDTMIVVTGMSCEGCAYADTVHLNVLPNQPPAAAQITQPLDGATNMEPPVTFSWAPANNASLYDLYLWNVNNSRGTPVRSNQIALTHDINSPITYQDTFYWQVVSKNSCFDTWSDTFTFNTRLLPDLMAVDTSIHSSDTVYQRQTASVQWKVTNTGLGTTGNTRWDDYIYLSPDPTWNPSTAILVHREENLTWLQPNQSYTNSATFNVGTNLVGKYYVFVRPNGNNRIIETTLSNNYVKGDEMTVLVPTTPDLEVVNFAAPQLVNGGDTICLSYSVINHGDVPIVDYWHDAFYLSPDSVINISGNRGWEVINGQRLDIYSINYKNQLSTYNVENTEQFRVNWVSGVNQPDTLLPDSTYTISACVVIPHCIEDTNYLFAFADDNNRLFEDANTNNANVYFPTRVVRRPFPDLVVKDNSITAPAQAFNGDVINITWVDSNQGFNNPIYPYEKYWNDKVYLSPDPDDYDLSNARYIGSVTQYNAWQFTAGSSLQKNINWNVPTNIHGDYYVYVYTDANNNICEWDSNANNVTRGPIINFDSLYADLRVESLGSPAVVHAWQNFSVNWSTKNYGNIDAEPTFNDRLYIWPDTDPLSRLNWHYSSCGWSNSRFVDAFGHTSALSPNASYSDNSTTTIPMPTCLEPGNYYMTMAPDWNVYRTRDTNSAQQPVEFKYNDDLTIDNTNLPTAVCNARDLTLEWQVENIGGYKTKANGWADYVYLSKDSALTYNDDVQLASVGQYGFLDVNSSYTKTANLRLPDGCNGKMYVILDVGNYISTYCCTYGKLYDTVQSNNTIILPIDVQQCDSVDLIVQNANFPAVLYSGQQSSYTFTVENQGTDVTPEGQWYESVYLSNVPDLVDAMKIGTYTRTGQLAGNSTYNGTMNVNIPGYISGNYYIVMVTDRHGSGHHNYYNTSTTYCGETTAGNVYEHQAEHNNMFIQPITIIQPDPSDLIVTNVTLPDTVELGKNMRITYSVKNDGVNPAQGFLRDGFFFSADRTYDGYVDQNNGIHDSIINLNPGNSFTSSFVDMVVNMNPGKWNGVMYTDIINQIYESDESNNTRFGNDSINLVVTELPIDTCHDFDLDLGDVVYRKVQPGAGTDMVIELTSNQSIGRNEVYVAYDRVPTQYDFDYLYPEQISTEQQVLVPNTGPEPYYIMVRTTTDWNATQTVTLCADTLPFTLLSHEHDTVGQGRVTSRLKGARFNDTMEVWIEYGKGQKVYAELLDSISTMEYDIRWRLDEVPTGTYDIMGFNKAGSYDTLFGAMTVVPTEGLDVSFASVIPEQVRCGSRAYWIYYLKNTSNVDIPYWPFQFYIPQDIDHVVTHSINVRKNTDYHNSQSMSNANTLVSDSQRTVPFIASNIRPGEVAQVNLLLGPLPQGDFPVVWKQFPMTEEWHTDQAYEEVARLQAAIQANPSEFTPEAVSAAASFSTLKDSLFAFWHGFGLLDTSNLDRTNTPYNEENISIWNEPICGNYSLTDTFMNYWPIPWTANYPASLTTAADSVLYSYNSRGQSCTEVLCSFDPNDITGPTGYGIDSMVSVNQPMDYRVRFENDSAQALAAAQQVFVTVPLDADLDISTLRLGDFGFGDFFFDVPEGRITYSANEDLPDSLGYDMRITAGLDVPNREAYWLLETIDPATGLPPTNVDQGILPVNDSTGRGEGFVLFSIQPDLNSNTGDEVHAQATITFDINAPILTNVHRNTIDAVAPTSTMNPAPSPSSGPSFPLSWNATDDLGGSGVGSYSLYASQDSGIFQPVITNYTDTVYTFTGSPGSQYRFFTLAKDNTGNQEAMKNTADVTVEIPVAEFLVQPLASLTQCLSDSLLITWDPVAVPYMDMQVSADSGSTWYTVADSVPQVDTSVTVFLPQHLPGDLKYLVRAISSTTEAPLDSSEYFTILPRYEVDLGTDTQAVCVGGTLTLDAGAGASSYLWSDNSGSQTLHVTTPGTYWVETQHTNGCVSWDTVVVEDVPAVVGGTLAIASDTVCYGATSDRITLSGYTGTVQQWEASTDEVSWTVVPNTDSFLEQESLTQTTYYRVLVQSATCGSTYSDTAKVVVRTLPAMLADETDTSCTCMLTNNGEWIYFSSLSGLIAGVKDVNDADSVHQMVASITELDSNVLISSSQYYLPRVFNLQSDSNSAAQVRLFFTQREFDSLQAADPAYAGMPVDSLYITKVPDGGTLAQGRTIHWNDINVLTNPLGIANSYGLEFDVDSFSTFYIHFREGVAPPPAPEIMVKGNQQEIADGQTVASSADSTEFGSIPTGSSVTVSYWIYNTGHDTLFITNSSITGTGAGAFSVAYLESDTIEGRDSSEMQVTFSPVTIGSFDAEVEISNDDDNENLFTFAIHGEGTASYSSACPPWLPGGVDSNNTPLRLWVIADSLKLSNSDPVTMWDDLSCRDNDASAPSTATNQPSFVASNTQFNDHATVHFDGDDYLMGNLQGLSEDYVVISVVRFDNASQPSGNADYIITVGDPAAALSSFSQAREGAGSGNTDQYFVETGNGTKVYGPTLSAQGPTILDNASATNDSIYVNNAQQAFSQMYNSTLNGDFVIGARDASTGHFEGDIAEIIVFKGQLTTTARNSVANYLAQRYGVSSIQNERYTPGIVTTRDFDHWVMGLSQEGTTTLPVVQSGGLQMGTTGSPSLLQNSGDWLYVGHNNETGATGATPGLPSVQMRLNRSWFVDKTDVGNNGGSMILSFDMVESSGLPGTSWNTSTGPGAANDYLLLYNTDLSNPSWQLASVSAKSLQNSGTVVQFTLDAANMPGNAEYTIGTLDATGSPVPVELSGLFAHYRAEDESVWLHWETASEEGSDKFVIERSQDGYSFEPISEVKAAGWSTSSIRYAAPDREPFGGINYYRLRKVDLDGSYEYSPVVPVMVPELYKSLQLEVQPNPAAHSGQVKVTAPAAGHYQLTLTNHLGQPVLTRTLSLKAGTTQLDLNLDAYSAGVYHITLKSEMHQVVKKWVIQR